MAQVDMFLKLDGVEGESVEASHKGEIQIQGFQLGVMSPRDSITSHAKGARRWSHLSVRATVDMSTPKLFEKLKTNFKIPKAVLTCRKAGKEQFDYFKVTLFEVMVVKVQAGELEASGDDVLPKCDFDLAFGKIEITACPQTSGGPTSGQVVCMDDLMSNA